MPYAASPFRIAVADDVAQNVAHMTARIAQAAEAGAALVCFPEYSLRSLNADWIDLARLRAYSASPATEGRP